MKSMSALHLDYQSSMRAHTWSGTVLLFFALIACILMTAYYAMLSKKLDQWEEKAEQMQNTLSRQHVVGPTSVRAASEIAVEVKHAKEIVQELTLPWGRLFQAIESVGGKDVTLLTLEPNPEKKTVKIGGEAKNMMALLNYLRQLQDCDAFSSVYLQSHQVQRQDIQKPVRFLLLADWRETS